ncbi:MAG: hypothetical protein H7Z21_09240 [Hymenobacter sp.]|nr:hypothetical protein [Hymenobacter sp.]
MLLVTGLSTELVPDSVFVAGTTAAARGTIVLKRLPARAYLPRLAAVGNNRVGSASCW